MTEVTQILYEMEQGDAASAEKLLPLVYEELRKLAAFRLVRSRTMAIPSKCGIGFQPVDSGMTGWKPIPLIFRTMLDDYTEPLALAP